VSREKELFKAGSTTYYWSSVFFPENTRHDVFKLYSFVRVADNFVDAVPQDKKSFVQLKKSWQKICKDGNPPSKKLSSDIRLVVQNMYDVYKKYEFDQEWVDAFLVAMESDISKKTYKTLEETKGYMYGSAEVIGLMMAKIIGVPEQGYEAAKLQGRAMQYINFIRDIAEDNNLGRQYFAVSELHKYGLPSTKMSDAYRHPAAFREFIEAQLAYYNQWQAEASKGFKYIPHSQRIALRTAVDMYNWTAAAIAKNPFIVFDKKIKPSKSRVVARALVRSIHA
jgi:phytoene synthase